MNPNPFADDQLYDVVTDVMIRFHEHDQYGSKEKALAALQRRAQGFREEEYVEVFDFYFELLEVTIKVVKESRLVQITPTEQNDEECEEAWNEVLQQLAIHLNSVPKGAKLNSFINWVHFWRHLK